jgi:hypothetical protein
MSLEPLFPGVLTSKAEGNLKLIGKIVFICYKCNLPLCLEIDEIR